MLRKKIAATNSVGVERIFNFRPCLFVALFLCFGILFSYLNMRYGLSGWWSLAFLPAFVAPYFLLRKKSAIVAGLALAAAFFVGFACYGTRARDFLQTEFYNREPATIYGRVTEITFVNENYRLILDDVKINGKEAKGKLFAYLPMGEEESARCSDWVFLQGEVTTRTELFGKFAVSAEDFSEDIRYVLSAESHSFVAERSFDPFAYLRELLRERLTEGMTEDAGAVAYAIMCGDTTLIGEGLLENIRAGGIAHIFAVSGLHIGTLFAACLFVLSKIKVLDGRDGLKFFTVVFMLIFYGGVCGYSESVLRAVVTCLVGYGAKILGVKGDMLESLGLAALILLIVNPVSLFCVGFQLSFAACFGIAFLSKPLQIFFDRGYRSIVFRNRPFDAEAYPVGYMRETRGKIISFLSVTLSAQAATAPILLNAFGYLSAWGLLLNAVFVPLVGGLFSLTMAFCAIACFFPVACSGVLLWIPNLVWTTALLLFEAVEFSKLFEGLSLGFPVLLAYYSWLLCASDKINFTDGEKWWWKTLFFILFAVGFFVELFSFYGLM